MSIKSISGTALEPVYNFHELTLDEKTYKLAFSYNAIAKAESVAKVNLMNSLHLSDLDVNQFRATLYAALSVAHPKMTIEQAGELIKIDTFSEIRSALLQAWSKSMRENPLEPAAVPASEKS